MASNGDIKAHEETYGRIMVMLKWGTIACFLLGMTVVVLIGS
jgi:hypothetical protein